MNSRSDVIHHLSSWKYTREGVNIPGGLWRATWSGWSFQFVGAAPSFQHTLGPTIGAMLNTMLQLHCWHVFTGTKEVNECPRDRELLARNCEHERDRAWLPFPVVPCLQEFGRAIQKPCHDTCFWWQWWWHMTYLQDLYTLKDLAAAGWGHGPVVLA